MNDMTYSGKKVYFAKKTGHDFASALKNKIDDYYSYLTGSGLFSQLEKSYLNYYGLSQDRKFTSDKVREKNGTFATKINHYRNMALHILNLVSKDKTAFEALARTKTYNSLAQVKIAKELVNLYFSGEREADSECHTALEYAVFLGGGDVMVTWDADSGTEYGVSQEGKTELQGDVVVSAFCPVDVISEKRVKPSKRNWVILRDYVNKWDLAAKFPEHEEAIMSAGKDIHADTDFVINRCNYDSDDYVHLYRFFHRKSAAIPDGKEAILLGKTVLYESDLSYPEIPVYNLQASSVHKTSVGYGQTFDLLGLTELYDKFMSMLVSKKMTCSKPTLEVPAGANYSVNDIGGIRYITTHNTPDGKSIKPMKLADADPELLNVLNITETTMEKLSGLSSVQRGDPASNLKSGNALALVASQSYQFVSTLDQNHKKLLECVATAIISRLKQFATTPRIENITGSNNQSEVREFTRDDLSDVMRVRLQVGSPLARTLAGRLEIAQNLIDNNMITTPEQYFMVMETGRADVLYDSEQSDNLNIESENEMLLRGEVPTALMGDPHHKHIKEHLAVLHNPTMRTNVAVISAVKEHIEEHKRVWQESDLNILRLTNTPPWEKPLPPAPLIPSQSQGAAVSVPKGVPEDGSQISPGNIKAISDQIKMPKNPMTGQEFQA